MKTETMLTLAVIAIVSAALSGCGSAWDGDNDAPVITAFSVNGVEIDQNGQAVTPTAADTPPLQVAIGASILGYCQANDLNRDPLTYTWRVPEGITSTGASLLGPVFTGKAGTTEGIFLLSCSVNDGRGVTVERHVRIGVFNPGLNHAPLASLDVSLLDLAPSGTHPFVCTASDPDTGDVLSYQWCAQRGSVNSASGATSTYTAPATTGNDTVYCIVGDGRGAYTTATATVTVK